MAAIVLLRYHNLMDFTKNPMIISDSPIASPLVREPGICVVMNKPSLEKFENRLKPKGTLIINKSLVEIDAKRKDIDILEIPVTDMASSLGNVRTANMIALGALLGKRGILKIQSLIDSLNDVIPKGSRDMAAINEEAIKKGYEYGSR